MNREPADRAPGLGRGDALGATGLRIPGLLRTSSTSAAGNGPRLRRRSIVLHRGNDSGGRRRQGGRPLLPALNTRDAAHARRCGAPNRGSVGYRAGPLRLGLLRRCQRSVGGASPGRRAVLSRLPTGSTDRKIPLRRTAQPPIRHLSFRPRIFCSHLLFLYSQELDLEFHLSALSELTRVAAEVRVFPMISLDGTPSPHVEACRQFLERRNVRVAIEAVPFEFQRGADRVFRAWRTADSRQSRRDWAT